ncbi:hypothetical protein Lalb_Chr18g0050121 [Lupinus albus]|uniref:Uncharacterized protein n=1 Tax=Lupinus albus TaxID=3870 RepID=A0A6A4P1Q8_LUPAL|nr:hypothetical protein Lalb_Chr18g0050121 [Lupinus albus]
MVFNLWDSCADLSSIVAIQIYIDDDSSQLNHPSRFSLLRYAGSIMLQLSFKL